MKIGLMLSSIIFVSYSCQGPLVPLQVNDRSVVASISEPEVVKDFKEFGILNAQLFCDGVDEGVVPTTQVKLEADNILLTFLPLKSLAGKSCFSRIYANLKTVSSLETYEFIDTDEKKNEATVLVSNKSLVDGGQINLDFLRSYSKKTPDQVNLNLTLAAKVAIKGAILNLECPSQKYLLDNNVDIEKDDSKDIAGKSIPGALLGEECGIVGKDADNVRLVSNPRKFKFSEVNGNATPSTRITLEHEVKETGDKKVEVDGEIKECDIDDVEITDNGANCKGAPEYKYKVQYEEAFANLAVLGFEKPSYTFEDPEDPSKTLKLEIKKGDLRVLFSGKTYSKLYAGEQSDFVHKVTSQDGGSRFGFYNPNDPSKPCNLYLAQLLITLEKSVLLRCYQSDAKDSEYTLIFQGVSEQ